MKFDDIKWIEVVGATENDHEYRYFKEKVFLEVKKVDDKLLIYINGEEKCKTSNY